MNILGTLVSVMSGTARHGRFRWPAHLMAATAGLAMAAIISDAGFATVGTLFTALSLIPMGFAVAGLVRDLRREMKGAANA